jgi:two-component system sensor histidine kinase GlrK
MNLDHLNQLIDSIIRRDARIIKLTEEALDDLYSMTAAEDKYIISGDQDYDRQLRQIRSDFTERMSELEMLVDTEAKTVLLADIKNSKEQYDALLVQRESITTGQETEERKHQTYVTYREQITGNIDQKLRNLVKVSTQDRDSKLQQSKDMSNQVANIITASEFLAIFLVIIITFVNARKISLPIKLLGAKTEELAGGTFSDPLKIASPPEVKELADAFNVMCERLKELDQMRIDYISHLSHELRTPLTVIKEASSMLQEGVFSKVPDKQEELFVLIKAECERLISSVNRILDFSLMEAGNMLFSFQNGDIQPIIGKSVSKLSPLTRKKKIDITLDIPQNIPFLRIDAERLEQVFENLLGNALKYTQEGGKIIISTKINSENQTIEVSVSDNGRGIPEDGLVQVFDKFKRVDDGRGAVMGTGLGLSIVRHIINAHGGHIWVKSKKGEGSTFTFSLPVSL